MAATKTLLELRSLVRQQTDQEQSTAVSDSEIDSWINEGVAQVWQDLVSVDADRGTLETPVATVAGQELYTLPNDFLSLRGLDYPIGGGRDYVDVKSFEFKERNQLTTSFGSFLPYAAPFRFRVARGNRIGDAVRLQLRPAPPAVVTLILHYVTTPKLMTADVDVFDGIIGFEAFPVAWAASKVRGKLQEDASGHLAEMNAIKQRIKLEAGRRDRSGQKRVARVRDRSGWGLHPYYD